MVKIINKTSHQRIYTLTDGTTLKIGAYRACHPFEDSLICSHIKSDEKAGVVSIESVNYANENDTKTDKGGKK